MENPERLAQNDSPLNWRFLLGVCATQSPCGEAGGWRSFGAAPSVCILESADQRGSCAGWSPASRTPQIEVPGGTDRPRCPLTQRESRLDAGMATISPPDLFSLVGEQQDSTT